MLCARRVVSELTTFLLRVSGAIMQYVVEKLDMEHELPVSGFEEKTQQSQWLLFLAVWNGTRRIPPDA